MFKPFSAHPLIFQQIFGLLLLLSGLGAFIAIAESVVGKEGLVLLDYQITHWFEDLSEQYGTGWMLAFTHMHGTIGLTVLTTLMSLWLLWRRAWPWLLALLATMCGGTLLNVGLKHFFQRPRPEFEEPILFLTTYSFPSGHTIGATLFYGFLAIYLSGRVRSWSQRTLLSLAAILLVVWVAVSRIYLGAHYLSDVVAAMAMGLVWLSLIFTLFANYRWRHLPAEAA